MADKVADELIGDRRDHSTVSAQEGKRASAREEYIRGFVPG